jgi:hypothetical protein
MSINKEIRDKLPEGALVFDNASYDNSIIGITVDGRAIYSFERMVQEYMNDNGCDEIDAIEWVEYNTIRALPYAGDKAPVIVYEE